MVAEAAAPFAALIARLVTIPGIGQRTAEVIVAETGDDMAPVRHRRPAGRLERAGARFRRLARRPGKGHEKKAAVAVAHALTCIAWAVLYRGEDYAEAGEDYYERRPPQP